LFVKIAYHHWSVRILPPSGSSVEANLSSHLFIHFPTVRNSRNPTPGDDVTRPKDRIRGKSVAVSLVSQPEKRAEKYWVLISALRVFGSSILPSPGVYSRKTWRSSISQNLPLSLHNSISSTDQMESCYLGGRKTCPLP